MDVWINKTQVYEMFLIYFIILTTNNKLTAIYDINSTLHSKFKFLNFELWVGYSFIFIPGYTKKHWWFRKVLKRPLLSKRERILRWTCFGNSVPQVSKGNIYLGIDVQGTTVSAFWKSERNYCWDNINKV